MFSNAREDDEKASPSPNNIGKMRVSFAQAAALLPALTVPSAHLRCSPSDIQCIGAAAYTVRLVKPLGIMFEENAPGKPEGVSVGGLVEGGNAERDGRILIGDALTRVSAVQFAGQSALVTIGSGQQFTSFSRELIPVSKMDFDTIMSAIGSNEGRYGYTDVVLELQHTDSSVPRAPTQRAERLDTDGSKSTEWDAAGGTKVNGKSTPLRPPPDNFGGSVGRFELRPLSRTAVRPRSRVGALTMMASVPADVAKSVKWNFEESPYDPAEVEALWDTLVELYNSDAEAAATAAKQVRGDVICPLFASPTLLRESYEALVDNLGETEAREIMAKHPAILTCGPGIRGAEPDEIRRLATLRNVMDRIPPSALLGVTLALSAAILGKIALIKLGYDQGVF